MKKILSFTSFSRILPPPYEQNLTLTLPSPKLTPLLIGEKLTPLLLFCCLPMCGRKHPFSLPVLCSLVVSAFPRPFFSSLLPFLFRMTGMAPPRRKVVKVAGKSKKGLPDQISAAVKKLLLSAYYMLRGFDRIGGGRGPSPPSLFPLFISPAFVEKEEEEKAEKGTPLPPPLPPPLSVLFICTSVGDAHFTAQKAFPAQEKTPLKKVTLA